MQQGHPAIYASLELLKELDIPIHAIAVLPKDWKRLEAYYHETKGLQAPEGDEHPIISLRTYK